MRETEECWSKDAAAAHQSRPRMEIRSGVEGQEDKQEVFPQIWLMDREGAEVLKSVEDDVHKHSQKNISV